MKYRKFGIYLLTALFAAAILLFAVQEREKSLPLYFVAETEGGAETILLWDRGDGEAFVFLPGYLNPSDLEVRANEAVWIGDTKLSYGMTCSEIQLGEPYSLSGEAGLPASITFLKSGNLPTVYIDTVSESMEYVHEVKGNKEFAQIRMYDSRGLLDYSGSLESIQARGNSSFGKPKKQYSISLSAGADLLEMGTAKKWILLANSFDPTNLRNKIVFDFAAQAGLPYSPDSRWVDLYLNGTYAGLYQLSERNELHPQRVAVDPGESSLLSVEFADRLIAGGRPYIQTSRGTALRIHSAAQDQDSLGQLIQSAEDAVYAPDGVDPRTGKHWTELIDLDSWARKYLIEEIFGNVDGGRASQFCYVSGRDGLICAGPVWDYDLSMSNPATYFENGAPQSYRDTYFGMFLANYNKDTWFYPLYRDELFRSRVEELYKTEFRPLLEDLLGGKIAAYAQYISDSARMNQVRWSDRDIREETDYILACISGRIDFLDSVWIDHEDYVMAEVDYGGRIAAYALKPGQTLPPLPDFDGRDWYDLGTGAPVDFTQPIYEHTSMYQKYRYPQPAPVPEDDWEPGPQEDEGLSLLSLGPAVVLAAGFLILCAADVFLIRRSDPKQDAKRNKIPT